MLTATGLLAAFLSTTTLLSATPNQQAFAQQQPRPSCPDGAVKEGGKCVFPVTLVCLGSAQLVNGQCINEKGQREPGPFPRCLDGGELVDGQCVVKPGHGKDRL